MDFNENLLKGYFDENRGVAVCRKCMTDADLERCKAGEVEPIYKIVSEVYWDESGRAYTVEYNMPGNVVLYLPKLNISVWHCDVCEEPFEDYPFVNVETLSGMKTATGDVVCVRCMDIDHFENLTEANAITSERNIFEPDFRQEATDYICDVANCANVIPVD